MDAMGRHRLNENWSGFPPEFRQTLEKCLTRKVSIVIKSEKTELALRPNLSSAFRSSQPAAPSNVARIAVPAGIPGGFVAPQTNLLTFNLREVVEGSKLLRASSDSTRVKVSRLDPKTKSALDLVFNLEKKEDLWLRDGDVIEVPEKQ
jgi:hypothetical protein